MIDDTDSTTDASGNAASDSASSTAASGMENTGVVSGAENVSDASNTSASGTVGSDTSENTGAPSAAEKSDMIVLETSAASTEIETTGAATDITGGTAAGSDANVSGGTSTSASGVDITVGGAGAGSTALGESAVETGAVETTPAETLESVPETTVEETTVPESTEAAKKVKLSFHVVDEDGEDVDEKYVDVKVSFDQDGVLTLDDSEKAPVRNIRKLTGTRLFGLLRTYSKNYTYKEATLDGDIIRAIRKTTDEDEHTVYEYTMDGENWTAFEEDSEILLVYCAPETKGSGHAEYIEEGKIKVVVDLKKDLPEGVELRVQEVTDEDQNYDAYMTALDDAAKASASEIEKHSNENTLLYDIAFIGHDEDGQEYEYQPGEDVSVKVSFLGGQLAGELGASDAENVVIKHLPVKDEVKENAAKDGQRTTADMTDLSADDIQVEDVKKAKVTLDTEAKIATVDEEDEEEEEVTESKDEVTFGVESFCVFAFSAGAGGLNNAASWEGSQTISVKSFKDKLGLAGHTAIYASVLDNTSDHLEGSIVVDTFNDSGNNVLNFAQRLVTQNEIQSITITKKVYDVSSAPREFKMGFYSDSNGKNKEADVTVTVPANKLSGSICIRRAANPSLFNVLANHSLYVYEIDDKGNPSKDAFYDADENKKYSVAYENPENSSMPNEIESDKGEFGNYINVINRADQYGAREYFGEKGFHTYLGSDYADDKYVDSNNQIHSDAQNNKFLWIKHADGTDSIRLQDYKDLAGATDTYIHNLGAEEFERRTKLKKNLGIDEEDLECVFAKESIRLADAKRGTTKGKTNFNVINLISSSGKLVDDLKYANFHEPENGHAINSLLQTDEKDDEYLLINIDATNKDTYVLNQLSIDGENADSNDGYPRIGSHVIYNFVKKTSDGNFVPYTGTIEIDNVAAGMIFAPKATVRQVGGFRGSIVAYHVNRPGGAEIHQKCIGSSERRYVDITVSNTAPGPETTSVDLEATKILNGQTLQAGQFSFNLEGEDGSVLQTKQNTADGKIKFGRITYKEEDAGKTFNYTIKEVTKTDHNYKYDTHAANVTVKVEKDASGKLTATANYEDSKLIFTNTYINTAEGSIVLGAKKVLEGKDLIAGQFSFQLKDSSGKVLQTATNDKDGNIVFKEITYTLSDVGTKTYKIEEVNGKAAGYTYDDHVVDVKVNVTDNNDGTLVTSATYDGKAGYTFKNSYAAAGSVVLKVRKELSGRKLAADQFTFELLGADGTVLQSKKNAADGSVTFDAINYTEEAAGKKYRYQIREVNNGASGYTYDDHIVDVEVSVTDNNDGTLAISATYDGEAGYTFKNSYAAAGSVVLKVGKELNGRKLAADQFTFELVGTDGTVLQTKKNAADGSVTFDVIDYTQEDSGKSYSYQIREVNEGAPGYTYDDHIVDVKVSVTDNNDGTLATSATYDGEAGYTFTNTYTANGSAVLTAKKVLEGKNLAEGQFSFELKDKTGKVLETVTNAADGTISFAPINYSLADVGTKIYTIHEVEGGEKGYTYDKHVETVTVKISDKGDGTLDTAVDYDADGAVFTNYSIDFKVNKFERTGTRELDGAKIQIKDSTGVVIAEWISKSGETHDFGSSLKAGETYTIHEETAPSGYYTISDVNFTVDAKGQITLAGSSEDVKLEDGVIKICDERIKSSGGGGGGDHPHPTPETTPAETTPAETTVPETTPVETTAPETNPGGGNGGHHGPSEEVETDEFGNVLGANRGRNKKGQDGGNVKGASRGKTRTGDESMMSIFGFGFLAAVLVLLGWFGIRFTKRNRR